jgi:hypothetical protein
MLLAVKISLLFSGLFLLVGMLTGVWKYASIMRSPEKRAPVYVDIAHRNSLLFSFAAIVIAKLIEFSPFGEIWQLSIVGVLMFFFVLTSANQIMQGFLNRTENIFLEPDRFRNLFMYALIVGEVGSVTLLLGGFVYTQFLR